jgi:hypothetical protein
MAAGLVLAAAVPGTLAASSPAAALTSRPGQPGYPVSVAITKMTPRWAGPGAVITVAGTITNESKQPVSNLQVQLEYGSQPIAGPQYLRHDLESPAQALAYQPVTGRVTQPPADLAPGASATWSVRFSSKQIGMTSFGVYPLTADVSAVAAGAAPSLVTVNAFLPYVPASRGKHVRSARPPRQQIAWLWPLIDVPLAAGLGQSPCSEPAAEALAASLAPGGRLNSLLAAGRAYTRADQLTWAVDPALLADAGSLASCARPGGQAAAAWLRQAQRATAGQQLFTTPYANVNLSLIGHGHVDDVTKAFGLGRILAGHVLGRSVQPSAAGSGSGTAIAWPSGYYSPAMLANLALVDQIRTFVLPSNALAGTPATAFSTPVAAASVRVLTAASPLTQVLGAASGGAASQFTTTNQFLAETALMAGRGRANPIVVAPPQRPQGWHPSAALANALLADTADAPWLVPVSLSRLAGTIRATDRRLSFVHAGNAAFYGHRVLRALLRVDRDVQQIKMVQADHAVSDRQPSAQAQLALAALESADWSRHAQKTMLARLATLAAYLEKQRNEIVIVADSRVTLGGLKGNVPVVIDNRLSYPVRVRLQASPVQPPGGGVTVQQHPDGLVEVPPHSRVGTTLHVQATNVGSTTITLRVLDQAGHPIPGAGALMTVQATQFGTFAMIILAAALGIFVLASAARGLRRGRPGGGERSAPREQEAAEGSKQPAGADTVVSERGLREASPGAAPSELGAASPPR